jgi:hypothetical protein
VTLPPATLHLSTGFPIVIGLHQIEDFKRIKVSNEKDVLEFRARDGSLIQGFGVEHGYHHYVIATRPRCMFDPNGFCWDKSKGTAVGNLEFEVGYKKYQKVPFKLLLNGSSPYPFPLREGMKCSAEIDHIDVSSSPSGHPNRLIFHANGKRNGFFLEPDLLHFIELDGSKCLDDFDFRVEYIGISTGKSGNRDFADRLWNHEKVREISGEIQRDSPNRQVYIFGYQSTYLIESYPMQFITGSKILESMLGTPESAQVMEAALIKHFQPAFNTDRKDFLITDFPHWLPKLRELLAPAFEKRGCGVSVVMAPDCRYNANGPWKFGGFYTEHTRKQKLPSDLITFYIDLTEITK